MHETGKKITSSSSSSGKEGKGRRKSFFCSRYWNSQRNKLIEKTFFGWFTIQEKQLSYCLFRFSPFAFAHTRGLKVVNSRVLLFHKIFIEFGSSSLFIDNAQQRESPVQHHSNNKHFFLGFHSSIGLFGRVILSQQIKQWALRDNC